MSYDYNSQTGQLNIPNPHRLENRFLFVSCGLYFCSGVVLLLLARGHVLEGVLRWPPVLLAVMLMLLGAADGARAFRQLRYFFGRGRPVSLAPEVPADMQARSAASEQIKEVLRSRSLQYPEPAGAFNGLLYWLVPNLIHAPAPIRALASRQFSHALTLLILFVAFLIAFVGVQGDEARIGHLRAWLGLGFAAYVVFALVRPAADPQAGGEGELTTLRFVIVAALAILAPVALTLLAPALPPLGALTPYPHVFILFLVGLLASALFFMALVGQLSQPPQTLVEQTQEAWNLRIHPGQIIGEFERAMMERWTEGIPNRIYARILPSIDMSARAGEFQGEIIEETQPLPLDAVELHLGTAAASTRHRWILALSIVGVAAAAAACISALYFGWKGLGEEARLSFPALAYTLSFASLGFHCARAAGSLWQRVDFESRLYAMEFSGHYVTAQLEQGRMLDDRVRAASSMVKIEGMTFRIWATRLTTVILGKDAPRHILGMNSAGLSDELVERLRRFVREQSVLIAPTADDDVRRQVALEQLNGAAAASGRQENLAPPAAPPALQRFCPACGTAAEPGHRFCSVCGTALGN